MASTIHILRRQPNRKHYAFSNATILKFLHRFQYFMLMKNKDKKFNFMSDSLIKIRLATFDDISLIYSLIQKKAEYDH